MGHGIKAAVLRRLRGTESDPYIAEAAAILRRADLPAGPVVGTARDRSLRVAFVLPPFRAGSGGHQTVANLVRGLEAGGHECSLWIDDPGAQLGSAAAADFTAWFGPFRAGVRHGTVELESGAAGADVVVATGWQTASLVRTVPAAGRAYLVQDHEPEFFGTSVQRKLAEASYSLGLHPITAGGWLADLMGERYGSTATRFDLGIDGRLYRPLPGVSRQEEVVLAYTRWSTPRRAVPVVLAALSELHRRRPEVQIWTFGQDGHLAVDFPHRNLGVLADRDLPGLYAQATTGLVLSMTNHSLVSQEMLACGLPCVELDSPSVVSAFGRDGAIDLAPLDPDALADALGRLLDDRKLRSRRAEQGAALRAERTWARAAAQVELGLRTAIAQAQASQSPA